GPSRSAERAGGRYLRLGRDAGRQGQRVAERHIRGVTGPIQAQEQIKIAQAGFYPTINADGSTSRQRTPNNNSASDFPGAPDRFYNTNYDLGLNASWQLDLFGEIRNQAKADKANYIASLANRDAIVQSLIAQLVNVRLSIANINEEISLIEQTVASRQKSLEVIENRYKLGIETVSALDVRLARENLGTAQAQLPPLQAQLTEQVYALNILLGETPDQNDSNSTSEFPVLPPPDRLILPPPVALLDLRPDLRVDEYRIAAAKYDINVALTNLYPSISISGGYGFSATEFGDLISAEKITWNLLTNVTQPLFQGGRLRANVRLNESRARELANQYSQNILVAMQEVENALQQEENLRKQLDALIMTNEEAQKAYDLAENRYKRGLIAITDLLDIERRVLSQKQQILNIQQAIWLARINLHLAVGGQWVDHSGLIQNQDEVGN
ncbi:MAG: efflux transporter outer membrane subunit, partial [Pseudomonadota bacterium]